MTLPDITQVVDPKTVSTVAADRVEARTVVRDFYSDPPGGGIPDDAGETYTVPVPADELEEPEEVEPGADTTYDREEYGRPTLERHIWKKGSKIPEEDINDNVFDLLEDHVEGLANQMAKLLDREAFNVLSNAAPTANAVGDDNGTLDFADINAGATELAQRDDGYTADMALVGPQGKETLTNYLADRGTDLGDEAVQNGWIGEFAGIDFMFSNNISLGGPDAIVVDTDHFGYEGEWQDIDTDQWTDQETDSIKVKIKAAYGWAAARDNAAVYVQG